MSLPKVFVLDDDPTGTQAVHGVPVLTVWDEATLEIEFDDPAPAAFVLTNTRALPEAEAVARTTELARNLRRASQGREFRVVSRSDSTLRGHFPAEVLALAEPLGLKGTGILLCPYFGAGGRVTIKGVHYLREGETLTPIGETEFARDSTFGYGSSNLVDWVAEKSGGQLAARLATPETLGKAPIEVLSCADDRELGVWVEAIRQAEAQGRRFLFRSAASFAAAYAGISPCPLLQPGELSLGEGGLLFVVGSYVEKSSRQLSRLCKLSGLDIVELDPARVIQEGPALAGVEAGCRVDAALEAGRGVVLHTSRTRHQAGDLGIGAQVSQALVAAVRALTCRPRALIAKGGITSSDLATDALSVRRAWVRGQVLPGVALWECGPETRWPGLSYVVFPGNVGPDDALVQLHKLLAQ